MEKEKKKKTVILFICLLLLLLLILICLFIYRIVLRNNIEGFIPKNVSIEYGSPITLNDLLDSSQFQEVLVDPPLDTLTNVGNYSVKLTVDNEEFDVSVVIEDTTAPSLEVQDLNIYLDEELPLVTAFVVQSSDLSSYELVPISLEKTAGEHEIEIIARDIYGNETKKVAKLTVLEDKEAPILTGLSELVVEAGDKPNLYNGVSAVDSRFGNVDFTVDDTSVNYNVPGTYSIVYIAKDPLGNKSRNTRKITILEKSPTYMIENFPVYNQYPNYPNGCESIALYNLLRYYNVSVTPEEIVERLKKGDGPYWDGNTLYGGNPEIEFVGDPRDIHGYGVYQKPIRDVANTYKSGMVDYTGHSLDEVLELVKEEIPVQVWVSINLKNTKVCAHWTYVPTDETIDWICDLHSVVIIGYNRNSVYVSDSYTGRIEEYSRSQFEKMYNLFGKRALYYPE